MMQKQTHKAWLFALVFCCLIVTCAIILNHVRRKNFTGVEGNARIAAIIEKNSVKPFHPAMRAKETDCAVRGSFPDPECTPGAIFPEAAAGICTKGYTKTVRNVPVELKSQVYAEYGLSYPQLSGAYEADHLIPLELGGNNSIANLFPEAAEPRPGFHEKDLVENYLNHEVCAGHISLIAAQEQIGKDWLFVYNNLTPGQIAELQQEFSH